MASVPTSEPISIRAGDSVTWQRVLPEYPASAGWALAYRLIPETGTAVEISATGSGDTHTVALARTATASIAAGRYTLVGYATLNTERATLYSAPCQVLPDLSSASSYDGRSAAEIALAAAKTAQQRGVKSYTVGDRQTTFHDMAELIAHIRYLEQQVAAERAARALAMGIGAPPGRIMTRM